MRTIKSGGVCMVGSVLASQINKLGIVFHFYKLIKFDKAEKFIDVNTFQKIIMDVVIGDWTVMINFP